MFCANCGKQIPDGAKFCPKCGMNISDVVNNAFLGNIEGHTKTTDSKIQKKKKLNKKKILIIIVVLFFIAILTTGGIITYNYTVGRKGIERTINDYYQSLNDNEVETFKYSTTEESWDSLGMLNENKEYEHLNVNDYVKKIYKTIHKAHGKNVKITISVDYLEIYSPNDVNNYDIDEEDFDTSSLMPDRGKDKVIPYIYNCGRDFNGYNKIAYVEYTITIENDNHEKKTEESRMILALDGLKWKCSV
ncbi:MAG: zinc ribbon domain-containing protein [Ruminococcaceae bacterium]|nr:zinc ribbon domain-containing protein [Oscillospiraceae bacterium]